MAGVTFYQKHSLILAFSETLFEEDIMKYSIEEYAPERIYFARTGRSVDTEHEIGDIILPNVFLQYNTEIDNREITPENRDRLMGSAEFVEIFTDQRDYYVENFGLSIGGMAV